MQPYLAGPEIISGSKGAERWDPAGADDCRLGDSQRVIRKENGGASGGGLSLSCSYYCVLQASRARQSRQRLSWLRALDAWVLGVAGGSGSSSSSVRSSSEKKTGREEADDSDGRRWATVGMWALKWSESGGMGLLLVLRLSRSQGLWRGAALASAPMRRILGVRAHAWQETIAGMARQRGNRLIMGGDCQGGW